ncbi:hypothetical protein ZWY2020_045548 [Hordeum vulgare]|nr:hypothetical protein ZWY2020_045548 [Hordeum vulgare]
MMPWAWVVAVTWMAACTTAAAHSGEQPLSRIAVERTTLAVDRVAHIKASPTVLGLKGQDNGWVELEFFHPDPSGDDWIGVFSPANFSAAICEPENKRQYPRFRTTPIKVGRFCSVPFKRDLGSMSRYTLEDVRSEP